MPMLTLFHRRWMRTKSWLSCSIGTRHRFVSQSCRLLGDAQFVFIVLTSKAHTETIGWNSGLRQVCRNAQRHGCVDRSRRVAFGVLQNIVPWTATMSSLSSPSSLSFNRTIPAAWELNQLFVDTFDDASQASLRFQTLGKGTTEHIARAYIPPEVRLRLLVITQHFFSKEASIVSRPKPR